MIFSGYLRGTSKVAQAHLHPIYLLWSHPPALPAPFHQGGWALACLCSKVGKCISANAAEKEDCKGALSFLQSQLLQLPELVQGQDRSAWQEQAGHRAAIELHLLVTFSHLAESCQGRGRRSCSSSSLLPQPPAHSPWDGSSNQIALGQINSENWPSGNLTLRINKYANKRTVCCQICQPVNWADSP